MLYTKTVDTNTLELLKELQAKPYLKGFFLAGGTALALRIGHRKSVDLDLFSDFSFDVLYMQENLSYDFDFELYYSANNTIKGSINGVKVDVLSHRYPVVDKPFVEEGIKIYSLPDIIAMKLNAIAGNGQRVKDFIDIYFLLKQFNIAQMVNFYKNKYSQYNEVIVLKSLVYFEDVDVTEWPVMIKEPKLKWEKIKRVLEQSVKEFIKNII